MDNGSQHENGSSLAETAEYIGVSKDALRNWIGGTGMPAHKIGRLWKFKKTEVGARIANSDRHSGDE